MTKSLPNIIGNRERRMCGCKKRYTAEMVANKVISKLQKKEMFKLVAYNCPFCHYWHIGRRFNQRNKK